MSYHGIITNKILDYKKDPTKSRSVNLCNYIMMQISSRKYTLTSDLLDLFIEHILDRNEPHLILCTSTLLEKINPSEKSINNIVKSGISKLIEIILPKLTHNINCENLDHAVVIYLIENDKCIYSKNLLEKMVSHNDCIYVKKIIDNKIQSTKLSLLTTIKNNNTEMFDILIDHLDCNIIDTDVELLLTACSYNNIEIIKKLLEYGIVPTKECFRESMKYNHYNHAVVQKFIKLFIKFGYVVDYDDVTYMINRGVSLNNVKLSHIKFDDALNELCIKNNILPYDLQNKKCDTNDLLSLCKNNNNVNVIKKVVKKGAKPDTECLRNVCKTKNCYGKMKYLIDNGAVIDDQCLKNLADAYNNKVFKLAIDEYIKTKNKIEIDLEKNELRNVYNIY